MAKRSRRGNRADLRNPDKSSALDMTSVFATGNREIYIDNHRGIAAYTDELIKIKAQNGIVDIVGRDLQIDMIRAHDMFISGYIEKIEFKES